MRGEELTEVVEWGETKGRGGAQSQTNKRPEGSGGRALARGFSREWCGPSTRTLPLRLKREPLPAEPPQGTGGGERPRKPMDPEA